MKEGDGVLLHLHDGVTHLGEIRLGVGCAVGDDTRPAVDYHRGLLKQILAEFAWLDVADHFWPLVSS